LWTRRARATASRARTRWPCWRRRRRRPRCALQARPRCSSPLSVPGAHARLLLLLLLSSACVYEMSATGSSSTSSAPAAWNICKTLRELVSRKTAYWCTARRADIWARACSGSRGALRASRRRDAEHARSTVCGALVTASTMSVHMCFMALVDRCRCHSAHVM